jgi:ubiquinone/menaquinone biosynthesis C-methylase UbiE
MSSLEEVSRFENATWSRCARSYSDGFAALTSQALPALFEAVRLKAGDRVLDLGTGPGNSAAAAKARGAKVMGVDFSESMVEEARRRAGVEVQLADAHALPFEDRSFDVVIANLVVHHLGAPDRALREANRVLTPGGRLGFTVWASPEKLQAFGLFFGAFMENVPMGELPHGPLFGVADFAVFRTMVEAAGFKDAKVEEVAISWPMDSIEPYLASFRDWAAMDRLPQETRTKIEGAIRDQSKGFASGGKMAVPNPVILVSAVKP